MVAILLCSYSTNNGSYHHNVRSVVDSVGIAVVGVVVVGVVGVVVVGVVVVAVVVVVVCQINNLQQLAL